MRIRYSFTSDISEMPEKVAFHLKHFRQKKGLEKQLLEVISSLTEEEINHATILTQVFSLREDLAKLDLLLDEVSDIITVCQQGPIAENRPEKNEKEKNEASIEKQKAATEKQAVDVEELQSAMRNIQNITGTLKEMRKKNA